MVSPLPRPAAVPVPHPRMEPPPPGRNLVRVAVGAVLVVVCAGAFLVAARSVDHRRPVLVVVHQVAPGGEVTAADVAVTKAVVTGAVRAVPASDLPGVLGRHAVYGLVPGSLLSPEALRDGPGVAADQVTMGLSVKAGMFPSSLRAGDRVLVFVVGDPNAVGPETASAPSEPPVTATVSEVHLPASTSAGSATSLDLVVARRNAAGVAGAGAAGRVVLAVAP